MLPEAANGGKGKSVRMDLCAPFPWARTLLGAKGIATRNKKLLGAPGIATRSFLTTRSKDATRGVAPCTCTSAATRSASGRVRGLLAARQAHLSEFQGLRLWRDFARASDGRRVVAKLTGATRRE